MCYVDHLVCDLLSLIFILRNNFPFYGWLIVFPYFQASSSSSPSFKLDSSAPLFPHIPALFYVLHLLYQELQLDELHRSRAASLVCLLQQLARWPRNSHFSSHCGAIKASCSTYWLVNQVSVFTNDIKERAVPLTQNVTRQRGTRETNVQLFRSQHWTFAATVKVERGSLFSVFAGTKSRLFSGARCEINFNRLWSVHWDWWWW